MIQLIDATSDSLTVTWPVVPGAKSYALEMASALDEHDNDTSKMNFAELSSKLTQPQAKKKNLRPNSFYFFRVAVVDPKGEWTSHTSPFRTLPEAATVLQAPEVSLSGNQALKIQWYPQGTKGYEIQMRENKGGASWQTIAPQFQGTEVRKKNLTSTVGYQFRVRPLGTRYFSRPSTAFVARGLSEALKRRWFPNTNTLLKTVGGTCTKVSLEEALGGKEFVLFYVSAHWCGPCRQFTPKLASWYRGARFAVEVVFVSADHDEQGFKSYFASHPWYAIDFDDDWRENLMGILQVQGIPRLVVLDAKTGNIVVNNAVGKPLVLNQWRRAIQR